MQLRRLVTRLGITIACIQCCLIPARAQDTNAKIMEGLFTKISQSFTMSKNTPSAGRSILILANPGIAIEPGLSPTTNQDDRRVVSRVLDRVPGPSWIYENTSYTISDIYANILGNHELPDPSITARQLQDLDATNRVLFVDGDVAKGRTAKYTSYIGYEAAYQIQVDAVESHRKSNGTVAAQYTQARQRALEDWQNLGYKNEIETATAKRDSLTSLDPNKWFGSLQNAFQAADETEGSEHFKAVTLYPSYSSWATLTGWSTVTLSEKEIHDLQTADHTSSGGSAGVNYGLWSFNAAANHSTTDTHHHSNIKVSSISMEVIRVSIIRPWMDGTVFRSSVWRWTPNAPLEDKLISDGSQPPGSASKSPVLMPYLPTDILVTRNVKIVGTIDDTDTTFHNDHTSVAGSVGWGPFAVGGHYEEDHTRSTFDAKIDGNGIEIPGMQIIGWYAEVLPKSPNPDLNLKWPVHTIAAQQPTGVH